MTLVRRFFVLDQSRCFGCAGCVGACARVNSCTGEQLRQLLKLPPSDGANDTIYLSLACNHCARAPCVRACPSGALFRDQGLGVVRHDSERCLGCRYCQMVCPFDAIRFDSAAGVVHKCDFCASRLADNRVPACIETCFSDALTMLEVTTEEQLAGLAREAPGFGHGLESEPMIRFAKPTPPGALEISPD